MVDLVKIRKKKAEREKAKEESTSRRVDESSSVPVVEPPAELPPPPAPRPDDSTTRRLDDSSPSESKLDKFKQVAGTKRTAEAAKAAEAQTVQPLELLTFVIAAEHYAVDIERIVEIVTPRSVTRIPNAELSVVGIMSLRGTIVTLVDVRRKLGHPPAGEPTADTRIVVVDFQKEMIGFVVDRVLRVVKAGAADIEPHPVVHAAELDDSIRGVFRVANALTILLDLDKLLDSRALAATP